MIMLCLVCHAPRELDAENIVRAGEYPYKPCVTCGDVGIYAEGDRYQQIHRKKAFRPAYQDSPYRGGKLRV